MDISITTGQAHSNAIQNFAHISRMVEQVESHWGELQRAGVHVEALSLGILFSDMGKSDRASEYIVNKYKSYEGWDQNTRMKSFLRHEDYGIDLVKMNYKNWGLDKAQAKDIIDTIVNHNGPGILESWWGSKYHEEFKKMYQMPKSLEGVIHSFLDRVDQGSLYAVEKDGKKVLIGGVRKIVFDETSRSPHKKFSEVVYDIFYNTPRYSEQQVVALRTHALQNPQWRDFFDTHFFKKHFNLIKDVEQFRQMIRFPENKDGSVWVGEVQTKNPQELFDALERQLLAVSKN